MAPWVALALVGLLLGATNLRAARGESFNYDLSGTDWPSHSSSCLPSSVQGLCQTGKKQSPINIVTSAVKRADGPSLLKVKHPLSREITVTNEEHAAAVSPQAGKRYFLTLPSGLHKLDHSDLQALCALAGACCCTPGRPSRCHVVAWPANALRPSSFARVRRCPASTWWTACRRPWRPSGRMGGTAVTAVLHPVTSQQFPCRLSPSHTQVPSIHLVDGVQAPMEAKFAYVCGQHHSPYPSASCSYTTLVKLVFAVPSIHLVNGVQAPMEAKFAYVPSIHLVNGVQAPMEAKFAYVPSIHLVNGVQAPMEAKFAYVNVANTTRKSVFTVFLKLHPKDKDNAWLDLWLNDIPAAVNGTAKIAAKTNFLELLSFDSAFWCVLHAAGCCVLGAASWVLGAGCCVLGSVCCVLGAVCCVLGSVCCVLGAVCCVLCAACCVLGAVCWVLRAGCCVLGAGCCVLQEVISREDLATYMNFLSRTNSGDRTNNRLPQPLNDRTVSVFRAS
ncbi:unnamed protein product [Closterium sp. NIES-64]|nr:unnamed protein product [Closterium sp. NIES-64]